MLVFISFKWSIKLRKMNIFDTSFLLYIKFLRGKAAHDICIVYGEGATAEIPLLIGKSSSNALRTVSFSADAELRACSDEFFEWKPLDIYEQGIENLVGRWEEVVNNDGEYVTDEKSCSFLLKNKLKKN